jgi:hypothetical protein
MLAELYDQTYILKDILKLAMFTLIYVVILLIARGGSEMSHVGENIEQYKCNPAVMPFVSRWGIDTVKNFRECTFDQVHSFAGVIMEPIYGMIAGISNIMNTVVGSIQSARQLLSWVRNAFMGTISTLHNRLALLIAEFRNLMIRVRNIIQRLFATFTTIMRMVLTGFSLAESVSNSFIGDVARFFCFAPDTPIQLASGRILPISSISIGDVLARGGEVTATYKFTAHDTPMVRIDGIIVSFNHKLFHHGHWIEARYHPRAVHIVYREPFIHCLATSEGEFEVNGVRYLDYDEKGDAPALARSNLLYLDGVHVTDVEDWNVGFHHTTRIQLAGGITKFIPYVTIGDRLADGGVVLGVCQYYVPIKSLVTYRDVIVGEDTLVLYTDGKYRRARDVPEIIRKPTVDGVVISYNLITSNNLIRVNDVVFRDEEEVSDATAQYKYDEIIKEDLAGGDPA